ncbi:DUF7133 domain-containing protein [Rhodopirellula bahusiensis]|uniref:Dehydrogenase n=1 Tax=Rhodopirellula bahusiensis TaxID=2014065 RepID=A0A2G1WB56_9BACT|nr:c-type cytochrome [Rhodopirellula bahusiensis]PHQ36050.1 dehydrogenase [Rhodopirellula bahusiensis]
MTQSRSNRSTWVMLIATWAFAMSLLVTGQASGQDADSAATEASEQVEPATDETASTIDAEDAVGISPEVAERLSQWETLAQQVRADESLRWISLFGSQIARLVPDDFRPVAADELSKALDEATEVTPETSTDDILQCEMVATIRNGSLVSDASRMRFSSQAGNEHQFGNVSFAVSRLREMDDESGVESESTAAFESDDSGMLTITSSDLSNPLADRNLAWNWRQQAVPTWNGSRWELALPQALISRLWIRIPANQVLRCEQAVVRQVRVNELPDWYRETAASDSASDNDRWVFLESAGSSRLDLQLQAVKDDAAEVETATIVRGCRMTFKHDGSVLNWQCRLVIDPQPIASIPPWVWLRGDVTRIEVDDREVPFTSRPVASEPADASTPGPSASIIKLTAIDESDTPSTADSRIVLLEGTSTLPRDDNMISLPEPVLPSSFVVSAAPWQLQWTMPSHLFATRWHLPNEWQVTPPPMDASQSSNSTATWNAVGPPPSRQSVNTALLVNETAPADLPELSKDSLTNSWRIELAESQSLLYANHQTRFLLEDNTIQARSTIQMTMSPDRLAPIELEIQDGFSFDSITVGETRRTLTINAPNRRGRRITIWPSPDEIDALPTGEGTLEIRATGQSRRDPNNPRVNELWMIRVLGCPGQMTAAVIPPADMGWTAETAITPSRIDFSELTTQQRRYFAPLPGDAIVLSHSIRQTPSLALETPDSTIVGSCQTSLTLANSGRERTGIEQRVQVQVEGLPQTSRVVKVRLAARSEQSPPNDMKWQTRLSPASAVNSVDEDAVTRRWVPRQSMEPQSETSDDFQASSEANDSEESAGGSGGWFEWSIPVPRNFNDKSLLIGKCFHATNNDDSSSKEQPKTRALPIGLFRLADATSQTCELLISSELQLARPVANLVGIPTPNADAGMEPFRYRYETSPHVIVRVRHRNQTPPANVVLQQNTHVIASASGTDRARTRFDLVATQPIEVKFPWDAHLIEARINGAEVHPELTRRHHLRFPATQQSELLLEIEWTTTSFEKSWIRKPQVTDLQVVGLTLGSQLRVSPAEDSLQIPLLGSSESPHLIFSQMVIGIGWVGAIVLLALSLAAGWTARWGLASGLALSLFAMLLWPEAHVPLTAWVALPLTIGLLRVATQHWQLTNTLASSPRHAPVATGQSNRSEFPPHSSGDDPTSDFSSSALLRSWLGWAIIGCSAIGGGVASAQTMDVLVPLDPENRPMGNKAYIPESLYQDLFLVRPDERVRQVSFLKTNYELDLTSERSKRAISLARDEFPIELLARFTVETSTPSSRLRLPFSPESIEELVLIRPDESTRVLTTTTDEQPGTLIVVPSGKRFDLQLRLRCQTLHHATGTQIAIDLPRLPQARLAVRRDYRIDNYRLVTDEIAWPAVDRPVGFGIISSNQFLIGPCNRLNVHLQSKATADAIASGTDTGLGNQASTQVDNAQLPVAWNSASQWIRRYWLNATAKHCSVECELDPLQPPPPGGEVILRFHRETSSTPRLISRDWKLLRQTPSQWKLTRVSSSDEPIRLVWDLSSDWSSRSTARPFTTSDDTASTNTSTLPTERLLSCPGLSLHDRWEEPSSTDESALTNSRTVFSETLVAWTLSSDLQPVWPASLGTERVSTEQFYSQWSGPISRLDRAAKSSGTTPIVQIGISTPSELVFNSRQEIHLDSSHQTIRLDATFEPTPVTAAPGNGDPATGNSDASGEVPASATEASVRLRIIKIVLPPKTQIFDWEIQQPGLLVSSPNRTEESSVNPETADATADEETDLETTTEPAAKPPSKPEERSGTSWELVRDGDRDCLLVRYEGRGMELSIEAQVALKKSNDNSLALIDIEPVHVGGDVNSANEVVISRSSNTNIQWKSPPELEGEKSGDAGPASMLASGKILMDQWLIQGSAVQALGNARFRSNPVRHSFQADVRVALRWEEGRWIAQTDLQLKSKQQPDFLDVEIPTRWCDALQISPLCASTRQPTLSPARQVIRIRLADKDIRSIRLTSRLAAGDLVRVSVPKIRVLQSQRSRTDIVVPNQLTNAPIRWETNGVEPMPKPRWKLLSHSSTNEDDSETQVESTKPEAEEPAYFRVANENWSVELERMRKTNNLASITHADHQLFNDRYLVSRFDIVPGDASHLTLTLPDHTRFVAGWTNGLPADALPLDDRRLQFLLPLSRLSQGIEILLEMDPQFDHSDAPMWNEIQTPLQSTFTRLLSRQSGTTDSLSLSRQSSAAPMMAPKNATPNRTTMDWTPWQSITPDERWQILATTTVRSIAAASDSLADRRDEEVASWMKDWLQRYTSISLAAGIPFDPATASTEDSVSLERLSAEFADRPPEAVFSWEEMESFLAMQIQRYSTGASDTWWQASESSKLRDGQWAFVLTSQQPEHWIIDSQYQSNKRELPPQWSATSRSSTAMQWAQHGMRFLLLLTSACLLIILRLHPNRNRYNGERANWVSNVQDLVGNPATWIFMLGCIALVLAPMPLALALMVTAVMLSGFEAFWKPLRKRLRVWASALLVLAVCLQPSGQAFAESSAKSVESPSPTDIANAMRMRDGWKLQLVAAEPLVVDPVSAAFDQQGRLWVVEMPDYPQPADGAEPILGRIRILVDSDGDGAMDRATTFADGLNFATGVLPWPSKVPGGTIKVSEKIKGSKTVETEQKSWLDGAIVTMAGEIAWLRDTDGDGVADDHQTLFRGFTTGNEQLRANHPILGPDGLVYIANGLRGGKIEAVDSRFDSERGPLTLSKNDFCFDPHGGYWGRVSGNSQHGLTIDDFGRRIGCSNRNPAIQAVLDDSTIQRVHELAPVDALLDIAIAGEHSEVHPISNAWTTSHLHAGQFSAACGVLAMDDEWLFVCEPTGSLVQRQRMRFDGENWHATREDTESEWLANEHTWFRPVDLVPDQNGAVLVVDMARAVIEHPDWVPEELKNRPDTWHGNDLGRIWRLVPPNPASGFHPIHSVEEAIDALRSNDAVRRSLATMHLTQQMADPGTKTLVVKKLSELLQSSETSPPGIARAAALLAQLGSLNSKQQSRLATESEPRLRAIAAKQTTGWDAKTFRTFAGDSSGLVRRVALENFLASDESQRIAGLPQSDDFRSVLDSLHKLAVEQADSKLIAKLLLSVPQPMRLELIHRFIAEDNRQVTANGRSNLQEWIQRSAESAPETTLALISSVKNNADSLRFVASWIAGARSTATVREAINGPNANFFARVTETAKAVLMDSNEDHGLRKEAAEVLLRIASDSPELRSQLTDSTDAELRSRILDGLLKSDPEWTRSILVSHPDPWRPEERGVVCRHARSDLDTATWLLAAVRDESLPRSFVDATTANALRAHRDGTIRRLANQTFAPPEDRAKVLQQYADVANRFSTANVDSGRQLFVQHCSNCHRMEDVGHMVGPDISDSRTKTAEALLVAILNPDAAIDASFTRYQILTIDGEVVSGLLHNENSESVTLLEAGNQQRRVSRDDIETFRAVDASLMPSGMEQTLSVTQMSDLIAYLKRWRYAAEGL